jgi:hypothetical protein
MDGQGADAEGDVSSTVMAGTTSHLKKKKRIKSPSLLPIHQINGSGFFFSGKDRSWRPFRILAEIKTSLN